MTVKKSRTQIASAVSLALSSMMLSAGVNAANVVGAIDVSVPYEIHTTGALSWNQENVSVFKVVDGVEAAEPFFSVPTVGDGNDVFDPINTLVTTLGDSFVSKVYNDLDVQTARVTGKVYPVGGPTGIKAVKNDKLVKNGKPQNCLINTSFLGENPAIPNDVDQYLDDLVTAPVICSSFFQSHKRFKIAMLPSTVKMTGEVPVAGEGNPIDLVFNVDDTTTLTPYQVFSKINNYTDWRLKGYKVQIGRGVGAGFQSASQAGIASQLYISLGIDEGLDADGNLDGTTDLFEGDDGLATFSHGLFGANDLYLGDKSRWPLDGFFDNRTAGFSVTAASMSCVVSTCGNVSEPVPSTGVITMLTADTVSTTTALDSNYTVIDNLDSELNGKELFGDWLPSRWAPKGIFFDDDGDATTDAVLVAWWDGTMWRKGNRDDFVPVSAAELNTWTVDKGYSIDVVEDVLNLGLNYIVKVGAINTDPNSTTDDTFTIRIVPIVADTQVAPAWDGIEPPPLLATSPTTTTPTTTTSSGGGGCAVGGNGRFDPTLPALLAMGLGFFGWRRFKAGK